MKTIVEIVVSIFALYVFQIQFGMWLGLGLGMLFLFFVRVTLFIIEKYSALDKEKINQKIRDENVLVDIEEAQHAGKTIYLAYSRPNDKFVLQAMHFIELANGLVKRFEGKNIYVISGETIVPLAEVVNKYQKGLL